VDAAKALGDLKEISTQIRQAVIVDPAGGIFASTVEDEHRARSMAEAATRLLTAAEESVQGQEKPVSQVEARLEDGSVAIVREGGRTIAATTGPSPTIGLVFYDLRACLRSLASDPPKRKRAPRKQKPEAKDAA
jgi:predicted regulator of Ras-like GTPase activity (Roadblock/LC7/MglB family)